MNEQEINAIFLFTVKRIADKYNCKIDVDIETNNIDFDCDGETALMIAFELDEIFGGGD